MAPFDVRIEGSQPVLLSNGNPGARGAGFAEWHDPWPKPSYLFALVAGDLVAHSDTFTTMSGREVVLNVWVRPGDLDKCAYAMDALKRSMRWDETEYGREYDLDQFNIVAVDDFNMGAMENKGLNIFNSRYVLASPDTATDADYARIESIIAHEYFHNWTGNRITCRDWFQLCLKEGLTVFRDQQFSADMRGDAIQRIADVQQLRARQFREDAGPLAHPVRPESYVEINNFYTATVYEKGAEVIRMLRHLVGADGYRRALDLYFDRHDGQACTIEDWLAVFEDATGRDLTAFARWYSQAGTPVVTMDEAFADGALTVTLRQTTRPTPGQPDKAPQVIPLAWGVLHPDGREVQATQLAVMEGETLVLRSSGHDARPVVSMLRGFSAPVILRREGRMADRLVLLAHDTDPFTRWEAGRELARETVTRAIVDRAEPDSGYLSALNRVVADDTLDPAFRALMLGLPDEDDLAATLHGADIVPDPLAIRSARETLILAGARRMESDLARLFDTMAVPGPYSPDAADAGRRALRAAALSRLSRLDGGARARRMFAEADNMTETVAALSALIRIGQGAAELGVFRDRWSSDRLVIDKWFAMQVADAPGETAPQVAAMLAARDDFDWKNPNRFRSVFGALAANHAGFHASDGAGYALMADWIVRLDPVNPQTAARMTTAFETWRRYDADRRQMAGDALRRIAGTADLSRDTTEMVTRMLA
ncbi:aminopeptidase N [Oceaniovalibus guishaninsula JLT2003]|uniref:Aminopeptidase N n=1 Tax=Oceaniovalibus guishaninsula JLT2003 TaxID=1231392 RepID=K2I917_9RHOB|nr:aminopeptidase N [Oceaniovalibus guishaninsula JLT2003]